MACELVKALTDKFPQQTTALFTEYVAAMLASYAANPTANWKAKDCAMYLVTALTVKGSTQAAGVTATNQLVNIGDFFTQQVCWTVICRVHHVTPCLSCVYALSCSRVSCGVDRCRACVLLTAPCLTVRPGAPRAAVAGCQCTSCPQG